MAAVVHFFQCPELDLVDVVYSNLCLVDHGRGNHTRVYVCKAGLKYVYRRVSHALGDA